MKRSALLVLAIVLLNTTAWAQFRNNVNQRPAAQQRNNNNSDQFNRFYYGGGGGFGLGTGYNYYSLFPIVGYRVTNDFSVGSGFTYQRYNYSAAYFPQAGSYTQYGLAPFLRYNINPFFVQAEMDFISVPTYNGNGELVRSLHNRFLVGPGYRSALGRGGSAFNILAMYDLLYTSSENGIFGSPLVVRLFVTFH